MKDWVTGIVAVLIAITGLAIIAVLVSPHSQTGNVFTDAGNAIKKLLCVATSPITGANCGILISSVTSTINYPGIGINTGGGPV